MAHSKPALHRPPGPPRSGLTLVLRSLAFIRPHRAALAAVMGLALTLSALSALDPLLVKFLFDQIGAADGLSRFAGGLTALLALEMLRALLQANLGIRSWDLRLNVEYAVREQVVTRLNALPLSYHQREGVGGTMTRINQAITGYVSAFADTAFNLLPTLLYLALSLVAMLRLDWRLALAVLVFTPLPALIGARAAPEQISRERRLVERWSSIYSRWNEVLAGMMTVKGFAMEEAERRRFLEGVQDGNAVVRRGVRTDTWNGTLRSLAATSARLTALALGGYLALRGEITIGTMVAFLGYVGGLFGPVQGITNTYQTLRKATVALEIIFEILDAEDQTADAPGAAEVALLRGEVRFRGITFGYQPDQPVLRGIDLDVNPGETVALIGPSGSGKSTLMLLLQRLYPLSDGAILVDGVDVRTMAQHSLRRQIGVVFQDAYIFNDTVRANIAYGRPGATEEEIQAAARAAHAHEFIAALPEGYDTILRERGSRLSGGQRQRIAIARALLRDPPILILDEATSALDSESEQLVQLALRRLLKGRTAFVVAHRLATVQQADRIVVLQDGRITEQGSPADLAKAGGYYASAVAGQREGFLREDEGETGRAA